MVHYYDLKDLISEIDILQKQYHKITEYIKFNKSIVEQTLPVRNIINYSKSLIEEKLNHITIHKTIRNKRGLINGLGTIIKFITGNLDNTDKEKFDNLILHIEDNQNNIQNQIKSMYSLNNELINNFNETIQTIQSNSVEIEYKINLIGRKVKYYTEIAEIKDSFNQLQILFELFLNTLQDIENSITFCKLHVMHPSIINTHQLFKELKRLETYLKSQLLFDVSYKNIINFENMLSVHCKIEENLKIIYFLQLPLFSEENFELFNLQPIPTKYENKLVTIIPETNYALKSKNNKILTYNGDCVKNKVYRCPKSLTPTHQDSCIEGLLLNGNISTCKFTELTIEDNHLTFIPEINQFLAVFITPDKIKILQNNYIETKTLEGIFLIKANNGELVYNNKALVYESTTYGKPTLIQDFDLSLSSKQSPDINIKLKTFSIKKINSNNVYPINQSYNVLTYPNIWTLLLYVILFVIILVCIVSYKKLEKFVFSNLMKNNVINEIVEP